MYKRILTVSSTPSQSAPQSSRNLHPTMPKSTQQATPENATPVDRRVAQKDNAGGRHRMLNDSTRAATRSRGSLSSAATVPGTPGDAPAPAEPTIPSPTPAALADEPRTGGKRVRSDSASSLSTQPITSPAITSNLATSLDGAPTPTPVDTQGEAPPHVIAEDASRTHPAPAADAPRTPTRTVPMPPLQHPASPETGESAPPSPPYQARMTPTYGGRLTNDASPPPHHLEPIHHIFHSDVPQLTPNPNHPHRPTDEVLARLQALRSQKTRKCDPQNSLTALVPTPRYGWPRVYHGQPDFLYTNLPDSTLDKWLAADGNGKKVIVQVMRQNSWCSPQCDATANLVVKTLEAIYDVEKIKVATASEQTRGRSQQNAPFSFLVFGLSTLVAERILEKHCFATEHIQFLAYPLIYAATPCHLGSISGLRNLGDNHHRRCHHGSR